MDIEKLVPPCSLGRQTQVSGELQLLEKILTNTGEQQRVLINKLCPVLRSPTPGEPAETNPAHIIAAEPPLVPLADEIRRLRLLLEFMLREITEVIGGLEL